MIKLIIFDYDGVIVDSFPNVHEVYMTICDKLGKSCPDNLNDFKKIYGHSSSECYKQLGFSEEERIKGNIIFKDEIMKKEAKPFEGIINVLRKLNEDYKLVLISSSYTDEVKQKLEKFGILGLFDFVHGKESHVGRFEKTEAIDKVMADLSVNSEETLLIGDRNVDFLEATKAGLKNVLLVDYGWGYDLSEIPDYKQVVKVNSPEEIIEAVKLY